MRHPRDCWGCAACVKACPTQAISYFLGADMGGRGTRLTVRSDWSRTAWAFARPDGTHDRIVVDRGEANRY